ncbi:MAG: SGNH/GDSL hydrolase family protein [Alicyclobacillus sp.]|nr:SGNH/GDSL hydrolase family protein [Alicyclobacillus sp.]
MRLWIWIGGAAAACCAAVAALVFIPHANGFKLTDELRTAVPKILRDRSASAPTAPITKRTFTQSNPLHVMAIGGSSAQGYDDVKGEGYLKRALDQVSTTLNIPIAFDNEAKSGDIPVKLAPRFASLLQQDKPDVVIISWGLLNDIAHKTKEDVFQKDVQNEVYMATQAGADVWIVTPTVTPATYVGHDVKLEPEYASREIMGARAVHSPNVHVFDLLNAMKKYLKAHHESYEPLSANNWHLNKAGHILAGQILAEAIINRAPSLGLTP